MYLTWATVESVKYPPAGLLLNNFMNVELEKSVTSSNLLISGKKAEIIPAKETGI